MVREFGIVQNNTQWPNGKSSIFIHIFGIPFLYRENQKKIFFENHGTTTRAKTRTNYAFAKNDVTIGEGDETFTGWEVRYLHSLGK